VATVSDDFVVIRNWFQICQCGT